MDKVRYCVLALDPCLYMPWVKPREMQKKLYMKDSRNLVNVQNPHYVCGNINDNFFIQ